jgi:hypothetical protein
MHRAEKQAAAKKGGAKRSAIAKSAAREVALMRASAIMKATELVLEAADHRPAWREFEYEWFLRRIEEARLSLASMPADDRLAFVDMLRTTRRVLSEASPGERRFPTMAEVAAGVMLEALVRLVDELEGRDARALNTTEEILHSAELIRRAGGHPYFNQHARTVDRLPKAKAISGSVWVVNERPSEARAFAVTHGPSGSSINVPRLPKSKLEAIARALAIDVPQFAAGAVLLHNVPEGPARTRLVGGPTLEQLRELTPAIDRAMFRTGASWGNAVLDRAIARAGASIGVEP